MYISLKQINLNANAKRAGFHVAFVMFLFVLLRCPLCDTKFEFMMYTRNAMI